MLHNVSAKRKKKEVRTVQPMPVYLPDDVHKALRIAAVEERRPATDIIRELVKQWLVKRKKGRGAK